jgi:hypothetical protein
VAHRGGAGARVGGECEFHVADDVALRSVRYARLRNADIHLNHAGGMLRAENPNAVSMKPICGMVTYF